MPADRNFYFHMTRLYCTSLKARKGISSSFDSRHHGGRTQEASGTTQMRAFYSLSCLGSPLLSFGSIIWSRYLPEPRRRNLQFTPSLIKYIKKSKKKKVNPLTSTPGRATTRQNFTWSELYATVSREIWTDPSQFLHTRLALSWLSNNTTPSRKQNFFPKLPRRMSVFPRNPRQAVRVSSPEWWSANGGLH